jgi:hypothetical protein
MLVLLICALNLCVKLTNKFGWGIKKKQEIENKIKKGKKREKGSSYAWAELPRPSKPPGRPILQFHHRASPSDHMAPTYGPWASASRSFK